MFRPLGLKVWLFKIKLCTRSFVNRNKVVESFCLTLIKADNRFFKFSAFTLFCMGVRGSGAGGGVLFRIIIKKIKFWLWTKLWGRFWVWWVQYILKKVSTFLSD